MPQSFKSKPPANAHKAKSSTQKKSQPKDPKKGGEYPSSCLSSLLERQLTSMAHFAARTIPPKKANLVTKQQVHRVRPLPPLPPFPQSSPCFTSSCAQRTTSSHASALEKEIAAQAMSHGKLTIMRKAAEEVKAREEKAKK